MWPFTRREQLPIPPEAQEILRGRIPGIFMDDGLSSFPDSIVGFDFRWAGKIHDWRYCSRCHLPGRMSVEIKTRADVELGRFVRAALPWRWGFVGWIVRLGVWRGGYGAFNSCSTHPAGATLEQLAEAKCRHGMPRPTWMPKPEELQ